MATSPNTKSGKSGAVLGRSAATGRFVLRPAAKRGSITLKRATEAAGTVLSQRAQSSPLGDKKS